MRLSKRHRYGSAAILVLAIATWSAWGLRPRPDDVVVATASVSTGPIVRRIFASGTLQAVTTVQVGSQLSGNIQELDADFNSIVKKGQVMAKLDPSFFRAQFEQAQANLNEARANLARARSDLDGTNVLLVDAEQQYTRAKELAAAQIETQSDLDAAEIAVGSAEASLQSQQASVAQAEAAVTESEATVDQNRVDLDRCIIRAPIDGIVIQRSIDVGQTFAASVQAPTLFVLAADLTSMQMEVDVDESDVDGIQPGEPVTFEVESYPGETFHGTVSQLRLQPVTEQAAPATTVAISTASPATTSVPAVVSYATIVTVSNPDERLRPGMTTTVTLDGARLDRVLRIPNSALSFRPSLDVLERLGETADAPPTQAEMKTRRVWQYDGKRLMPVDVGAGLADAKWTELVSGPVHSGDELVTNATLRTD